MRSTIPAFNYYAPNSLHEALNLLSSLDSAYPYAGGTDFLPSCRAKGFVPKNVVALKNFGTELSYIAGEKGWVAIGAMTTMMAIAHSSLLAKEAKSFAEAASQVGAVQIRNKATLGGNLCNASPAADTAPPLLTLDASVKVAGHEGERTIPLVDFFLGPGKTALRKGEILTEVRFKASKGYDSFLKIGRRQGEDISVASAAVRFGISGPTLKEVRVALGSVAPIPMRAYRAEKALEGKRPDEANFEKAATEAMQECRPITDVRSSEDYRRRMIRVLVKECLNEAMSRAEADKSRK